MKTSYSVLPVLAISALGCGSCNAQPDPVSGAAAAITAGVQVVQGLSAWIKDQEDDVAAFAYGLAGGTDCGYDTGSQQKTGYWTAFATHAEENGCAETWAQGLAQEGRLGSWSYVDNVPSAYAWITPPHDTQGDEHRAVSTAKTSVDGDVETKGKGWGSSPSNGDWIDGDLIGRVQVSRFALTVPSVSDFGDSDEIEGNGSSYWDFSMRVDGEEVFSSFVSLDELGDFQVLGDIPIEAFSLEYRPGDRTWSATLVQTEFEFLLGHLTEFEVRNLNLQVDSEMGAAVAASIVPSPGALMLLAAGGVLCLRFRTRP